MGKSPNKMSFNGSLGEEQLRENTSRKEVLGS